MKIGEGMRWEGRRRRRGEGKETYNASRDVDDDRSILAEEGVVELTAELLQLVARAAVNLLDLVQG